MSYPLLTRSGWAFEGPVGPPMALPALEVWLHHSVTTPTADPAADMRRLERIGKQRFARTGRPPRLSYSYAVHPAGVILEGQADRLGIHTAGRNGYALGIVWIGNYDVDQPTRALIEATAELLVRIKSDGIGPGRLSGGHRDVKATTCPGRFAYAAIDQVNALARIKEVGSMPDRIPVPAVDHRNVAGGTYVLDADGGVHTLGGAPYHGSVPQLVVDKKIPHSPRGRAVSLDVDDDGDGYTILWSDGALFAVRAGFHGRIYADPQTT